MTKNELITLFTEACSINSPSGEELVMAEWIKKSIVSSEWQVWLDESAKLNHGNCGNLYAYLEVNPKFETVVFSAHMDTVAGKNDMIEVLFDGKTFKSGGKTILGADDRVGVCSLISLTDIDESKLKNNILLFFPTQEESGLMGSTLFKFDKSKVKYIYNIDGGDAPGVFVYKSLGFQTFSVKVKGLSAHAAKSYEDGKNALLAAAELVTKLPIGRNLKEGWTFNIGSIKGGEKTNIVCDLVELKGELRAFTLEKIDELKLLVQKRANEIDKKYGITTIIDFDPNSFCSPHAGTSDSPITKVCKLASIKLGLEAKFEEAFYSSDANNYSAMGFETIVVSRGGKNAHSTTEAVELIDIEKTCDLVKQLAYLS